MKHMDSLRQKITFGYYAIGVLIVGLSLFAFVELRLIEGRVLAGERIADFFDATLEIRRFEKNFFLYRQATDAAENEAYVTRARQLLTDNHAEFVSATDSARVAALQDALEQYAALMGAYVRPEAGPVPDEGRERRIRMVGKEVVTIAEEIVRADRNSVQSSLERHRYSLIVSIVALILLVMAIGRALSRMVARPLKHMEESMEAVANGKRDQIDIPSADREVVSLTNAFNHVLQELDLRQKHLVRSEKLASLGTLLSGVAHELNNPLSNISSSCQILTEEGDAIDPEFRRELLAQIDEQTIRARNIVRSLLDFARDREFKSEPLLLARLVEETLSFLKGQVPTRVGIVSAVPADLVLYGDKQRLQQVFLNLIKNAVEALEGAGEVRITGARHRLSGAATPRVGSAHARAFGRCEGRDEVVDIEVRDNGAGIPPEILPRIFDPFFTTREVGKGSGLGLFIVFEIIEEHGGCIAVESEPGKGTVFYIRLPLPAEESGERHG